MRVLQIVHGYPPHGQGGAELYAESVATTLASRWGDAVTVLTRESVADAQEFRVRQQVRDGLALYWINNTFKTTRRFEDTYVNACITARAAEVIDAVRPDVAHIHHLTCLSTTIVDALAQRGIPVVLTLHDYWLICHRGQLFDRTLTPCDGPGDAGCAQCTGVAGPGALATARVLRRLDRVLPSTIGTRLRGAAERAAAGLSSESAAREGSLRRLTHMRERFAQVALAIAPSSHVRDRFVRAGFVHAPIVVSEYGVAAGIRSARAGHAGSPLRLGFAGALMVSKAPHLLAEAVASLPAGSVAVEMYGAPASYHGDDTYVARPRSSPGASGHHQARPDRPRRHATDAGRPRRAGLPVGLGRNQRHWSA